MAHAVSAWLLAAALAGAGAFNAAGTPATRADFARWGYPRGWHLVAGALEVAAAALVAVPASRAVGLALTALIVAAAAATVLRHREVSHLVPLGAFAALTALAASPF